MLTISNLLSHRFRLLISLAITLWLVSIYRRQFDPPTSKAEYAAAPLTGPLALSLTPQDLLSQPLASSVTEVPRLIHQSWKNDSLSPQFFAWSQTWRQQHPEWQWVFWTDADNYYLVVKYFPWFLDTYNRLPNHICRADVVRNMYMFVYGGMYADMDFESLRPFDSMFQHYNAALGPLSPSSDPELVDHTQHAFFAHMGATDDEGAFLHSVPNAWMASSPGHPFFTFVLRTLQRKLDDPLTLQPLPPPEPPPIRHPIVHAILRLLGLAHDPVPVTAESLKPTPEQLTGPVALHEALNTHSSSTTAILDVNDEIEIPHPATDDLFLRRQLFGDVPDHVTSKVHILPKQLIYPYSWAKETRRFKKWCEASSAEFDAEKCKKKVDVVRKGSYSITYWSHSWGVPW